MCPSLIVTAIFQLLSFKILESLSFRGQLCLIPQRKLKELPACSLALTQDPDFRFVDWVAIENTDFSSPILRIFHRILWSTLPQQRDLKVFCLSPCGDQLSLLVLNESVVE